MPPVSPWVLHRFMYYLGDGGGGGVEVEGGGGGDNSRHYVIHKYTHGMLLLAIPLFSMPC